MIDSLDDGLNLESEPKSESVEPEPAPEPEAESNEPEPAPKNIEHIVISGGGFTFFCFYGALKECHVQKLWDFSHIKTIYGTSAGSLLAVIIALQYDWEILDNFIIHRPWHNVFKTDIYCILNSIQEKGMYDRKVLEKVLMPLFLGKDLSGDITLLDLYNYSGIEIHMYTIEFETFDVIDISHKTHPDWQVIDAVYASCALPFLFKPLSKYFISSNNLDVLTTHPGPIRDLIP